MGRALQGVLLIEVRMRIVTVVNRTNKPLQGCWDGKHFEVAPGRSALNEQMARAAKLQNPIKGSDDPLTGNLDYYLAVEEDGDNTSPVEFSKDVELYQNLRSKAIPIMIVPGKAGMYSAEIASALTPDGLFTSPK
jgi:hypothetical protein